MVTFTQPLAHRAITSSVSSLLPSSGCRYGISYSTAVLDTDTSLASTTIVVLSLKTATATSSCTNECLTVLCCTLIDTRCVDPSIENSPLATDISMSDTTNTSRYRVFTVSLTTDTNAGVTSIGEDTDTLVLPTLIPLTTPAVVWLMYEPSKVRFPSRGGVRYTCMSVVPSVKIASALMRVSW